MYARACGGCGGAALGSVVGFDFDAGNGAGGGSYWPDPIRTDTDPSIPAWDPPGSAPGPEVAAAGAGDEMLGWILGAFLSAALISREA